MKKQEFTKSTQIKNNFQNQQKSTAPQKINKSKVLLSVKICAY